MINKITISACLIVKGEADLFRCLESIKDYIDEIIIVDTSPKAITRQIAMRYTDKFYTYRWNNNFSDARNFSISKATKDWVFIIDDDKYLTNGDTLRDFQPKRKAYIIKHYNIGESGIINCMHRELLLFKNNEGFRFFGRIHLGLIDKDGTFVTDIGVLRGPVLFHTGYSNDDIMKQKFKRNFQLVQLDVLENPHIKANYFYLARNYFNQARFLLLEKGKITFTVAFLLKKSMDMYKRYLSFKEYDVNETDAKKLNDLCTTILSFRNSDYIKKLITMKY